MELIRGRGAAADGLALGAATALALPSASLETLRGEALAALSTVADGEAGSVEFEASMIVGPPLVVALDEDGPSTEPFLPIFMDERIVTAPLAKAGEPTRKATALIGLDARGKPTVRAIHAGHAVQRLGEPGYAVALDMESEVAKATVDAFGKELVRRLRALHEAAQCLGLAAPHIRLPLKVAGLTKNAFALVFADAKDGREIRLEVIRNGTIFVERRRYDPGVMKLGLSDAEIVRTGMVSIEVDALNNAVDATFMTGQGRPAHFIVDAARPLEPTIDKTIPASALDLMRQRGEEVSLGIAAVRAATEIKHQGMVRSAVARLWSSQARQAHEDLKIIMGYCAAAIGVADEAKTWVEQPELMRQTVEAMIRHLPADTEDEGSPLRRALLAIGAGKALAATAD